MKRRYKRYVKRKSKIKKYKIGLAIVLIAALAASAIMHNTLRVGKKIDSYKGVAVFYNGKDNYKSHGNNYSSDGYYYGQKWQCIEFVKRFYYDALGHKMTNPFGNAKEYFDLSLKQGEYNEKRGLYQYRNKGNTAPKVDDILVFTNGKYGHVAIITGVNKDSVEIIQQNAGVKTRAIYNMKIRDGNYIVGDTKKIAGWLRKDSN